MEMPDLNQVSEETQSITARRERPRSNFRKVLQAIFQRLQVVPRIFPDSSAIRPAEAAFLLLVLAVLLNESTKPRKDGMGWSVCFPSFDSSPIPVQSVATSEFAFNL